MRRAGALFAILLAFATPAVAENGPYASTVMGPTHKIPNGGRPEKRIAFPEIRDWKTLKIRLERTECFGTCPSYKVEIDGYGAVAYDGRYSVAVSGKHRGKVSPQSVRDLYGRFKKAEFYWLFDSYRASVTDLPAYAISISFDGHAKKIVDYGGSMIGMPKELTDLENHIDAVAETAKWVEGNDKTFASLKAEGWDFRRNNDDNIGLLLAAVQNDQSRLVDDLLTAGVPIGGRYGCLALAGAALNRNVALVRKLMDAGAPVSWRVSPNGAHCDALAEVAARVAKLDPVSVRLFLDKGADPYLVEADGKNALANAEASGSTEAVSVLKQWMAAHPKRNR